MSESAETQNLYPFSRIFIGQEKAVVVCGPQIFALDSRSGGLLASATASSAEKNVSSIIRVAAIDEAYEHVVTSGEDKRLRVWSIHDLKELSCREIPKRANVLSLTRDGQTILVADKFGDIFSYPINPEPRSTDPPTSSSKLVSAAMHDNPEGTLILGHASIVTDFILTPDEKLVVSADRDEHIRVNWFPGGWDVDRYCMGHKKFVSALEISSCAPEVLLSGGGDPELYAWNFREGKIIGQIPVWDHVRPFIKVKGGRRKKENWEGKKAPKGKKKKGKAVVEDKVVEEVDTTADKAELAEEEVLVVSQIKQVRLGGIDIVVFLAIGSSALFYFEWPSSLDFSSVEIRALDLRNPIIELVVVEGGGIWASVDPTWPVVHGTTETTEAADSKRIRQLITEQDGESQLIQSLNNGCVIKGSANDIHALNLYEPLIALPKTTDWEGGEGGAEESGTLVPMEITSGPGLRASARQRNKEELEKRKALTQDAAQRATKQARVE